jgi:hypothetical protein
VDWQDWVLAASGLILGASLIPTIRGDDKPALSTGILTTIVITVVSVTMATMGLWLATATNVLIVFGWATITLQKYRQVRREWRSVIQEIEEEITSGVQEDEPRPEQARDDPFFVLHDHR